ncbi:MAG: hypothetical protein LBE34_14815 [Flavobacteriaceae bacterium]|jgi:hypothetical protein|nr:hypothetical protein [Flavobacteriaceae bacterium]
MKKIVFILCLLCCFACSKTSNEQSSTVLSYYYWRTNFDLDEIEKNSLKELNVKKLYIRYFDIALKGEQAIPVRPIIFNQQPPLLEVVPVIYIKNEVMLKEHLNTRELAEHLVDFISQINEKNNIDSQEIQLDCDWSLQSRDHFFTLIEELKKVTDWKISSTIRLHQVKYASKTGVPVVDHGALMYYNMGRIGADTLNSIYDQSIAKKYIGALDDYPLRLDYALPIYAWAIQIRDKQVVRLISRVREKEVEKLKGIRKVSSNRFVVEQEGMYFGQLFEKGDEIKIETTSDVQLKEMIKDLYEVTDKRPQEIILYDLNSKNIIVYDKETFKEMANSR